MARRRPDEGDTISLFPFLSILACTIGTLTLMIVSIAIAQINEPEQQPQEEEPDPAAIERARQNQKIQQQITRDVARLEELGPLIDKAQALKKQLASAEELLALLQKQRDRAAQDVKNVAALSKQVADLEKRIKELTSHLKETQEAMVPLKKELAERKKPPKEAAVVIRPGGSGVGLDGTFVECSGSTVVIYDGAQPQRIRREDLAASEQYKALLDRTKARPSATIVFLIRPDGLTTYWTARNIALENDVRNGKLPVPGQGHIDLSVFGKK